VITIGTEGSVMATTTENGGWVESFDNGTGMLDRKWGAIDTSVRGQVTLTGKAGEWADAGLMIPPTGAADGYGFGTYTFKFNTHGNKVGDYLLLWAADDNSWPDREYDGLEYDYNGQPYSATHYADAAGQNQADFRNLNVPGFDPYADHVLEMRWEDVPESPTLGRLTLTLDGVKQYSTTDHIEKDYAHGGENMAPGFGQQFFWNKDQQSGDNSLTVYEVSYTPIGSEQAQQGGGAAGGPADTIPGGGSGAPSGGSGNTAPATLSAGTGPDSLVLKISQDAYQGSAQYTVSVDGKQIGGTFTASASHAATQSDTLTLKGDWAAGAHKVSVNFLNDAWGGSAATDRNLYLDSATYNGQAVAGAAKAILGSAAPGAFAFTEAAAPAPVVTKVGTAGNDLFDATAADSVFTGKGGRDLFVFDAGDGDATITDFATGTDKLLFIGYERADVAVAKAPQGGVSGLLLTYGDDHATILLAGVSALGAKDMMFA
jgi:predicted xylan-binding protein with Ca-dependent carbohydrate-binding module